MATRRGEIELQRKRNGWELVSYNAKISHLKKEKKLDYSLILKISEKNLPLEKKKTVSLGKTC